MQPRAEVDRDQPLPAHCSTRGFASPSHGSSSTGRVLCKPSQTHPTSLPCLEGFSPWLWSPLQRSGCEDGGRSRRKQCCCLHASVTERAGSSPCRLPAWAWFVSTGWHLCAGSSSNSHIVLRAGLTPETLDVRKGHATASTASRPASPLSGGRGVCDHPRKGEQPDPRQSSPACRQPAGTGSGSAPGCPESQTKGHRTGWEATKGMWQLGLGSRHAQAPRTWKSGGQGALGFSKTYHPAAALQGILFCKRIYS